MGRSLIRGIFSFVLCAVVAACATGGGESSPEEALSLYVSAYLEGRYEEAWQHLSAEDREAKTLEAYLDERKDSGTFLARNLHRLVGHDILDVTRVTRPITPPPPVIAWSTSTSWRIRFVATWE